MKAFIKITYQRQIVQIQTIPWLKSHHSTTLSFDHNACSILVKLNLHSQTHSLDLYISFMFMIVCTFRCSLQFCFTSRYEEPSKPPACNHERIGSDLNQVIN